MKRGSLLCLSALAAMLLSGCSSNFTPSPIVADEAPTEGALGAIQGRVHGGNAPVTGAQIYIFATGTGGLGTASTSLMKNIAGQTTCNSNNVTLNGKSFAALKGACYVTTSSPWGSFNLSYVQAGVTKYDYSCTSGQQVYLVAVGGNPGLTGTGINNTYLVQMVGLGQCPASGNLAAQDPFVDIDEVTTVAFAYSMASFATDEFDIAIDNTTTGASAIAIAMANSQNIVDVSQGGGVPPPTKTMTLATGSSGTLPANKMTALADILATCVNTSGALVSNTSSGTAAQPCYYLMEYTGATFTGSGTSMTTTSDEAQAIFYIAQNPTTNVANIYNLLPAQGVWPVTPTLTTPTDWTIPIVFKNAVSARPGNIAFDSSGNAWVSDRNNNAVVKVTPLGVVTKFTNVNHGGVNGSIYQVAVDPSNIVWAVDYTYSQIYRLNTSGTWQSTVTGNHLSSPVSISFNEQGYALVLNEGNQYISKFTASGAASTSGLYNQTTNNQGSLGTPSAIAVDSGGNAFLPSGGGCACVGILTNNSTAATTYTGITGATGTANAIAMDASDDPWEAQTANNQIVEEPTYASNSYFYINFIVQGYFFFTSSNTVTATTSNGLNAPISIAFDGGGNLWAANSGASTVSGFNGTTALTNSPLQTGSTGVTYGAAPDLAGNLWTVNSDGTITELLGAVTPTVTPVYPGKIGVTP